MKQAGLEQPQKRILIVEDEAVFRDALQKSLVRDGFEVLTAPSGKAAQEIIALEPLDIVITDINMPTSLIGGMELLEYVRKNFPKLPVVLMTGFSSIAGTKEAQEVGASGLLTKPFKKEELLGLFDQLIPKPDAAETAQVRGAAQDSDFCKVSIADFISGKEIKFDIFIRLGEGRYVKVAHKGEDIPLERIKAYEAKGIKYLFMNTEDFQKYLEGSLVLTRAVALNKKVDPQKRLQLVKHTSDLMMEQVFTNEIDAQAYESARAVLDSSIAVLSNSQPGFDLLSVLNRHSDALYAHSLGVSLYSTLIAKQLGWTSPQTLIKISMAALFHDIGKKEIDRAILDKPRIDLTVDEIAELETHPARGAAILAACPMFSTEIVQVVQQHHENCIGTGYPARLNKSRISPMARLVSVANEFCNLVIANPQNIKLSPKAAIDRLFVLYREALDQTFTVPLGQILGLTDSEIEEKSAGLFRKD